MRSTFGAVLLGLRQTSGSRSRADREVEENLDCITSSAWPRAATLLLIALITSACAAVPTNTSPPPEIQPRLSASDPIAAPELAPSVWVKPPRQVWTDLRAGMELPSHLDHRSVKAELRWFRRNEGYFERLEPRFAKYQAYVTEAVAERGLPAEIALLPLVESALNPYAMSPDGAHGLWQFMPPTASRFGLKRDWWQDQRRDPIDATNAALDYLEFLYRKFDDWLLAVAAYNTGEGNLRKALRRAKRQHGKPVRDFFQLRLPRETRSYVPRLLAVAEVVRHPERYGVVLPEVRARVPFAAVTVTDQFDLTVVAEALGAEASEVRAWNPSVKQWATPPLKRHQKHKLILPKRLALGAEQTLAAIPSDQRLKWHRVTVRRGDTLSGIARRFGTSVAAVRSTNNLRSDLIRVNSVLKVPAGALGQEIAGHPTSHTYRVRSGDSLWRIGRKFGVSHKALMRLNGIGPRDLLRVGQRITIPFDTTNRGGGSAG